MNRLLLLAAFCAGAYAQSTPTCSTATIPLCGAGFPAGDAQVKPQAVPTSTTAVTGVDAYIRSVTITNTTASAITFTLADRQASPIAALSAVSIPANSTVVITFPTPYWAPGGFTVAAGGAGLNFYAAWRQ